MKDACDWCFTKASNADESDWTVDADGALYCPTCSRARSEVIAAACNCQDPNCGLVLLQSDRRAPDQLRTLRRADRAARGREALMSPRTLIVGDRVRVKYGSSAYPEAQGAQGEVTKVNHDAAEVTQTRASSIAPASYFGKAWFAMASLELISVEAATHGVVYKAEPVGDREVPDLELSVTEVIPEILKVEDMHVFYREQGRALAQKLRASLPGGTYDALLAALLETKLSVLRVPMTDGDGG